jgi:hypothetical protein
MKAKLLILLSCCLVLSGCEAYDSAFCRGDFCTDTSYIPNQYSDNASYDCGKVGSGMNSCNYGCNGSGGYLGDSTRSGSSCASGNCNVSSNTCGSSLSGCKETIWDNITNVEH